MADEPADARSQLYQQHAVRLEELAAWCDQAGLTEQAETARAWLPCRDPYKIYLFLPDDDPRTAEQPSHAESSADESDPLGTWRQRFGQLRRDQAEALFALASGAAQQHRPSLALQLASETIRENPDHAEARRILGYVRHKDTWQTRQAKRMLESGNVWHERFGWLSKKHVERYEAGQRRFGSRWIAADEDARRRQHIDVGWQAKTDHYLVTTNHSLEQGVELAVRLERLQQVWQQLFADYYIGGRRVEQLFAGERHLPVRSQAYQVIYYRDRQEYNDALRPAQPQIDMTLGIYFDSVRKAYFFAGEDQRTSTLYHEAAHQLFQETRRVADDVGRRHNFWILEGVATYMESLVECRPCDGAVYWALGGANEGRLPAARYHLLEDNFYVPLAELTRMGMEDVQRHPEIAKLYSQSAGLATFLMHYDSGRYRDALDRYLVAVYTGKAGPTTLAELTGVGYDQLDRQYRQFLAGTID